MKKAFALILALVALFNFSALADLAETVEFVDVVFEDGFQVSLPADWYQVELDEASYANGIFYAACSPDLMSTMQISWSAAESELTIADLMAGLEAGGFVEIQEYEVNGISFVGFNDADMSVAAYAALDAAEPGYYTFWFTCENPDDAFVETATRIVTSIYNVEL